MEERRINKIMDNITDDTSLCIIRDALTQYEGISIYKKNLKIWINRRIEESERVLNDNGTCYNDVIKNKDTCEYSEESENNNFEAGVISALLELRKDFNL